MNNISYVIYYIYYLNLLIVQYIQYTYCVWKWFPSSFIQNKTHEYETSVHLPPLLCRLCLVYFIMILSLLIYVNHFSFFCGLSLPHNPSCQTSTIPYISNIYVSSIAISFYPSIILGTHTRKWIATSNKQYIVVSFHWLIVG